MNRRTFLKGTGIGGVYMISGGVSSFFSSCRKDSMNEVIGPVLVKEGPFTTPLNLSFESFNGTLNAVNGVFSAFPGKSTACLGYNGGYLGPMIRKNSGETFSAEFRNSFTDHSNIHWHGLIIPENMDGHPKDIFAPGTAFQYAFTINQRAGMYWYHPHPHGNTARQAYKGLAGVFIVNDPLELSLGLPSGTHEIPLVIQDKRFFPDYSLDYSPNMDDIMAGYMGQYILVNGVYSPYHDIDRSHYRLRILNASNARIYNLAFSNGMNFSVIGSDAGLHATPVNTSSVLIGPGERLDIILDASSLNVNDEMFLVNKLFEGGSAQGKQEFRIMKFRVTSATVDSFVLPGSLSSITMIPEVSAVRTRVFDIGAHEHHGDHGGGSMSGMHKINGKIFDMNRIDETVNIGSIEIWTFDNSSGHEPHPIHIHGLMFQVLDRTGGRNGREATETGWKDTITLLPYEKVRVIISFPSNPGKFVFHCHNLEHADDGMMLQYEIV